MRPTTTPVTPRFTKSVAVIEVSDEMAAATAFCCAKFTMKLMVRGAATTTATLTLVAVTPALNAMTPATPE